MKSAKAEKDAAMGSAKTEEDAAMRSAKAGAAGVVFTELREPCSPCSMCQDECVKHMSGGVRQSGGAKRQWRWTGDGVMS